MARRSLHVELDAVMTVAERSGLGPVEPQILNLAKHSTVRLAPHPIVARIQSGQSADSAYTSALRELIVASHLASRCAPTARPAGMLPQGPYVEDQCVITLWEFAVGRAATPNDAPAAARALRAVHDGLKDVRCDLPPYSNSIDSCEHILSDAHALTRVDSNDRLFVERLYSDLRLELSRCNPQCRPIHGDAHLGNVLMTDVGATWIDLEATCFGPVEWDVVALPVEARSEFPQVDDELMRLLGDLRGVCVTIWCWADLDRSPDVGRAATHHLNVLKSRFA